MTRIRVAFAGFLVALLVLWLFADSLPFGSVTSRAFGASFTQVSGILSIGMMSFGALLAVRPRWLESTFDGLDKMYRLHKWLGVGGLSVGIVHWLTATGDGRGRPGAAAAAEAGQAVVGAATSVTDVTATGLQDWLASLHGPAHGVAQPALWVLIALVGVALIKFIPYRFFAKTHVLTSLVFALLAFHSIVLMKAGYWSQPIGWVVLTIVGVGFIAAFVSLLRSLGLRKQTSATVDSATYYPELHVLETELTVKDGWAGHQPGQFAFVTTDWKEGAHPFTIATAWDATQRKIGFIAKELGDHTERLREYFVAGKPVRIEGPYGRFDFDDGKERQIWVGAGIGITPFVAKMRERATLRSGTIVDLFHATGEVSEAALAKMRADAAAAGVKLHIFVSSRGEKIDAAKIQSLAPDWRNASVWFCGSTGFGAALKRAFVAGGLHRDDFHQELFEMR